MANEKPALYVQDGGRESSVSGYFQGSCMVGNFMGLSTYKGALRFTGLLLSQGSSLDFCEIRYKYSSVGESGTWKFKVYGIDEDNTGDFSSNPFGRSKTSASITVDEGAPTSGGTKTLNVKDIVKEIIDRGGWSSGNYIGFMLEDNGSSDDVYAFSSNETFLIYRVSAAPNLLPTPITVAAPTFPAADDIGIKISKPGYEVLTATRSQLLFTTREDVTKIKAEAQVAVTGGVEKLIAHGLSYKPECLVYIRKNGYSFELPRLYGDKTDPVGGGVRGYYSVDGTYLRIYSADDADVYYYILLDELAA